MLAIGDGPLQTYSDAGPGRTTAWCPGWTSTSRIRRRGAPGTVTGGDERRRHELNEAKASGTATVASTSSRPAAGRWPIARVFELDPATDRLRLIFHSPSLDVLDSPDNVCVSPRGGLVLCEDGSGQEYLHGLTTDGSIFRFAENLVSGSEWAGATFEPKNGNWLFVNLQGEGTTFAITGPWREGAL